VRILDAGSLGPTCSGGEPEKQEVKVFSKEEAEQAGEEAGPGGI
jgi:hypothetical protein